MRDNRTADIAVEAALKTSLRSVAEEEAGKPVAAPLNYGQVGKHSVVP